jgi:hypothetical protein
MFKGARRDGFRVMAGGNRAISVVQHLGGCGTYQHAPEASGVGRHNDQIEAVAGCLCDLGGGIAG